MYRQEGWVSARVRLQPELAKRGDKVFPKVRIIEGKHLVIRFEGNETLTDGELRQVLTFSESGTFDDAEIEESVGQIRGLYQAAARYFVTVNATKKQLGDKRYQVSFDIKEGPQVYARSISIAGNRRMANKHILDEMETKGIAPEGVVNALTKSAGIVQDERLINDLNRFEVCTENMACQGSSSDVRTPRDRRPSGRPIASYANRARRMSVRHSTPFCFVDNSMSGATTH